MLELPPELHLRIAECLSQADLFNFRLSCKTLSSAGHSALFSPPKASCLYIHPTTIQRFIDICHDDALATKVTTVIVLGDFMLDVQPSQEPKGPCPLPWPCSEGIDPTAASPSEKAPFRTAYKHVIAATKSLTNLQKIACATSAKVPGLSSTSDSDITTQARKWPFKAANYDKRPLKWSYTEVIIGLALNVPSITCIDAHCSTIHIFGGSESYDLLFPEGESIKARKRNKVEAGYWVRKQIFKQLNPQLRSLTYEVVDDMILFAQRDSLGLALLEHCSSITNVEAIISDTSIDNGDVRICVQACCGLDNLCSFKVRHAGVDMTLLSAERRADDNNSSTRTEVLRCASAFKAFLLQHAKTLETCVVDSIVSTSEDHLNILAGGLRGFSATGKDAQVCFRTYTCKPPPAKDGSTDYLKALRIAMEAE
ncbi:hypothetical protein KC320_g4693 [Hortaea werneckii]|nr:hypothetical protein KC320_g4693 [Hortaea werneckii]